MPDGAKASLEALEFGVARKDVSSAQSPGIVVAQDPRSGSRQPKGSTVTLSVSTGPPTQYVPDVTNFDEQTAKMTLAAAGFKPRVVKQKTSDPAEAGVVLDQDPAPGPTRTSARRSRSSER
jgi:eukaryotic-like serine/threonine-protein kinase